MPQWHLWETFGTADLLTTGSRSQQQHGRGVSAAGRTQHQQARCPEGCRFGGRAWVGVCGPHACQGGSGLLFTSMPCLNPCAWLWACGACIAGDVRARQNPQGVLVCRQSDPGVRRALRKYRVGSIIQLGILGYVAVALPYWTKVGPGTCSLAGCAWSPHRRLTTSTGRAPCEFHNSQTAELCKQC